MRQFVSCVSILLLFAGFIYAPFFHVHINNDAEDESDAGQLHAHLPDMPETADHRLAGHAFEGPHHAHEAKQVDVFAASHSGISLQFIQVQAAPVFFRTAVLHGFIAVQTVRTHDPPLTRSSAPRSPPA